MQEWRLAIILALSLNTLLSATPLAYPAYSTFPKFNFEPSNHSFWVPQDFNSSESNRPGYQFPTSYQTKKPTSDYLCQLSCKHVFFLPAGLDNGLRVLRRERMVFDSDFPLIIGDSQGAQHRGDVNPRHEKEKKFLASNVVRILKLNISRLCSSQDQYYRLPEAAANQLRRLKCVPLQAVDIPAATYRTGGGPSLNVPTPFSRRFGPPRSSSLTCELATISCISLAGNGDHRAKRIGHLAPICAPFFFRQYLNSL